MTVAAAIKDLEQWALDNYEAGGHWVYECFGREDYEEYLTAADGDLSLAKTRLQQHWTLICEREKDCAW